MTFLIWQFGGQDQNHQIPTYSMDHRKVNVNQLKVNTFGLTFHWKKVQVKS